MTNKINTKAIDFLSSLENIDDFVELPYIHELNGKVFYLDSVSRHHIFTDIFYFVWARTSIKQKPKLYRTKNLELGKVFLSTALYGWEEEKLSLRVSLEEFDKVKYELYRIKEQ